MSRKSFSSCAATRSGIKDVWNAFMVEDAKMMAEDIPLCPTTARRVPREIITWTEAKRIYLRQLRRGDKEFHSDAFVCWYIDDFKFDSRSGIWRRPLAAMKVLRHFTGIITPDFSICQDFPKPWKLFNTYRMRAFGYWCGVLGLEVINNVRWGTRETWGYCFVGIPRHSIVAIGTVASGLRLRKNRPLFEQGLAEMVRVLEPHTILVYGSANYACLHDLQKQGIRIIAYQGSTAKRFAKAGDSNEQK